MRSRPLLRIACVSAAVVAGALPLQAQDAETPVRELLAAFNAHDPERMGGFVAEDVEVFYVNEAGEPELGTRGRDELVSQMREYFRAQPSVRSEIEAMVPGPVYLSVRERIVGGASSVAVYEVREGLIRRVWYFPVDDAAA